ncbi:MAG TPA: YitT family protein [Bacillales bacterium]|nr:YitT family protein [Bacillales bacterium]
MKEFAETPEIFTRMGWITCGGMLQGMSMALFLFPHHIPSGGAAGLAILLNHFLHLPLGIALWFVNFSMLLFAIHWFGIPWTLRTMYAVTVTSLTIGFFDRFTDMPHVHLGIDLLAGSILFGLGVGLMIKYGASSGGMVIPALAIAAYRREPPGRTMFWMNLGVFLLTATVIDFKIVLFAVTCEWASTKIIDGVNAP